MNLQEDKVLNGVSLEQQRELIRPDTIFLAYRGSVAHGTYVPQDREGIDDKDIIGIYMDDVNHYLGMNRIYQQPKPHERMLGEWDAVSYEFRRFCHLATNFNPNIISALWVDERFVIHQHEVGRALREKRWMFSSLKAYYTFGNYAMAQLRKMNQYDFHGYMGEKRKSLVEKHGYDTKNAAHALRLLQMCIEFLKTGELVVTRPDNQLYIAIKNGEYPLEYVKERADHLHKLMEEAMVRSTLPIEPATRAINEFVVDVLHSYTGWRMNGDSFAESAPYDFSYLS